jgi:hypothetical protein
MCSSGGGAGGSGGGGASGPGQGIGGFLLTKMRKARVDGHTVLPVRIELPSWSVMSDKHNFPYPSESNSPPGPYLMTDKHNFPAAPAQHSHMVCRICQLELNGRQNKANRVHKSISNAQCTVSVRPVGRTGKCGQKINAVKWF